MILWLWALFLHHFFKFQHWIEFQFSTVSRWLEKWSFGLFPSLPCFTYIFLLDFLHFPNKRLVFKFLYKGFLLENSTQAKMDGYREWGTKVKDIVEILVLHCFLRPQTLGRGCVWVLKSGDTRIYARTRGSEMPVGHLKEMLHSNWLRRSGVQEKIQVRPLDWKFK